MNYVTALILAFVYLVSFAGLGIYVDEGHESGKLTVTEYRKGIRLALIPGVNTLVLIICLASALVHWLSFRTWDKNPKV